VVSATNQQNNSNYTKQKATYLSMYRLLGCDPTNSGRNLPTFRRNALLPFVERKEADSNKAAKQGDMTFLGNVCKLLSDYTESHPRRQYVVMYLVQLSECTGQMPSWRNLRIA
jgi:hypothetical protein